MAALRFKTVGTAEDCFVISIQPLPIQDGGEQTWHAINPFKPKLIMHILPTIQEENDWVM